MSGASVAFGTLLRSLRSAAGLSQAALAERARMSVDAVSAIERGISNAPQRATVTRLADALSASSADRAALENCAARSRKRRIAPAVPTVRGDDPAAGRGAPTNLPAPAGPLIGRDELVADLCAAIEAGPLVTLVGSGGIGKTRIALEIGHRSLARFPDGVWLVDFSALADGGGVAGKVAAELGVHDGGNISAAAALCSTFERRNVLLIFDPCEHVIEAVAVLTETLLQRAPSVRIIAASREPLRIANERVYGIPALTFPASGQPVGVADVENYAALKLFAERARSRDHRFEVTAENSPLIAEICRRVDGIALGIELAAARVRALSLGSLARRLEQRLSTLSMGSRSGPPHHQTMRALIDWSYDLLTGDERILFCRLAIFAGGWSLDAAEAVCVDERLDADRLLAALTGLVDKSQVVASPSGHQMRYRLLDSVREYALEKLATTGDRPSLEERLARWAIAFCERSDEALLTMTRGPWLEAVLPEAENVTAALRWALGPGNSPVVAARIAAPFTNYWYWTGRTAEARQTFESILACLPADAPAAVAGWLLTALSAMIPGAPREAAASKAVALLERTDDRRRLGIAYHNLATAYRQVGKFSAAVEAIDCALAHFVTAGLQRSTYFASALGWRASALCGLKRFAEARAFFERDIRLLEELGDDVSAATERLNLAELEFASDDVRAALRLSETALQVLDAARGQSHPQSDFNALAARLNITAYHIIVGDLAAARSVAAQALARAQNTQFALFTAIAIQNTAAIAALAGDLTRAARLYGFAQRAYREVGASREPTEERIAQYIATLLERGLGDDERSAFITQGSRWTEADAVREGLLCCRSTPSLERESSR